MRVHQVHVQRTDHFAQVFVLEIRQLFLQPRCRVIVDQGDGPGHDSLTELLLVFDQLLIDHFRYRLRSAFEAALRHHAVELREQGLRQRYADTADTGFQYAVHG